jgi:hypothetical protein
MDAARVGYFPRRRLTRSGWVSPYPDRKIEFDDTTSPRGFGPKRARRSTRPQPPLAGRLRPAEGAVLAAVGRRRQVLPPVGSHLVRGCQYRQQFVQR